MGRFLYLMFIGIVAGATSSILPRLMTTLASGDAAGAAAPPNYLTHGYLTIAACFSLLIGLITAILCHSDEDAIDSRQVFFYSLGIPALISGTLSTVDGANSLKLQSLEHKTTLESINGAKGIDIMSDGRILERVSGSSQIALHLIAPAHAQAQTQPQPQPQPQATPASSPPALPTWEAFLGSLQVPKDDGSYFNPSIRIAKDTYLVVLARSTDKAQAESDLAKARERFPQARLVLRDGQYLLLRDAEPVDLGKATIAAVRLEQFPALDGKKPALIRLPREFSQP